MEESQQNIDGFDKFPRVRLVTTFQKSQRTLPDIAKPFDRLILYLEPIKMSLTFFKRHNLNQSRSQPIITLQRRNLKTSQTSHFLYYQIRIF